MNHEPYSPASLEGKKVIQIKKDKDEGGQNRFQQGN
jgi:hypothetical protein